MILGIIVFVFLFVICGLLKTSGASIGINVRWRRIIGREGMNHDVVDVDSGKHWSRIPLFTYACCYVGGKADDMMERARRKKVWIKPEIFEYFGIHARIIAKRFRAGVFPYASHYKIWFMKRENKGRR